MSDRYWKVCERRAAKFFGTNRTPLSGINSRHDTSSDTLHPRLYIEVKSASGPTGSNGWLWRWLKGLGWHKGLVKITDGLYCAHSSYVQAQDGKFAKSSTRNFPDQGWNLYDEVFEASQREHKVPLIALFCKRQRGFWVVAEPGCLLAAIKEREAACASLTQDGRQG